MFTISLKAGDGYPSLLTFEQLSLRTGESAQVEFMSAPILQAYARNWLDISPPPPLAVLTAELIVDNSGGSNTGQTILAVTDLGSAKNAVAVLADNHNRIVNDLNKLRDMAEQMYEQMLAIEARV